MNYKLVATVFRELGFDFSYSTPVDSYIRIFIKSNDKSSILELLINGPDVKTATLEIALTPENKAKLEKNARIISTLLFLVDPKWSEFARDKWLFDSLVVIGSNEIKQAQVSRNNHKIILTNKMPLVELKIESKQL